MASIIHKLTEKQLIHPPRWLAGNICFETRMGSAAYGLSTENSDIDVYAIVIPRRDMIFPHLTGYIQGFGTPPQKFDQFQQHHIKDSSSNKEYDIVAINIVKFFELARQGNPNIIDMIFVDDTSIIHSTQVGNMIRENRKLFLSKVCWPRYRGYSYSQLKHLDNKNPIGKRKNRVEKYSYDVKFAGHLIRLLGFAEQILLKGDLDVRENNEQIKAVLRGEWTEQQVRDYFSKKENELDSVFINSKLRDKPDENKLKTLLLDCLETHYGKLENVIVRPDEGVAALREIDNILEKLKSKKVF